MGACTLGIGVVGLTGPRGKEKTMTPDDEAERYRKAADLALRQLAWCEEYFRSAHKTRLAQQVAANSASIRRRLQEPLGGGAAASDVREQA